jgi:hypothetical protein
VTTRLFCSIEMVTPGSTAEFRVHREAISGSLCAPKVVSRPSLSAGEGRRATAQNVGSRSEKKEDAAEAADPGPARFMTSMLSSRKMRVISTCTPARR